MTIKRRLFISNILMLIIPMLLSALVVAIMLIIFINVTNPRGISSLREDELFFHAVDEVSDLAEQWTYNEVPVKVEAAVNKFNMENNKNNIYLYIYEDEKLIFPISST